MRTRARTLAISAAALALTLAMAPAAFAARPAVPDLIQRDLNAHRIDAGKANLYRAYALGKPDSLPAAYRSDTPWDGTLVLLHLRRDVKRMRSGPTRDRVESILAKPPTGPSCDTSGGSLANQLQTTHFVIDYGTVGGGLSANAYGQSLEGAWNTEVTSFGWAAPPVLTSNPPPGSRYYVRIDALGNGLYGFTAPGGTYAGLVGNNPNTSWNDGDAYASCIVLNRDYTGFPSSPQNSLDSTTAHEFNHSLQYGYGALSGANLPDDDFVEGGATWMEDEVYDSSNDNYNYLWPSFADSMGVYNGDIYAYWLTFRGLTEPFGTTTAGGGEQVMQDFWEETSKNTGNNLTAMQTGLQHKGTTLADAFHAYAIAAKFDKGCAGSYVHPYCLEEGPQYVSKKGGTPPVNGTVASVGGSYSSSLEDNYSIQWVRLPSSGPYDVQLKNTSAGGSLRGTVACDTGSALSLSALPAVVGAGQSSTLPSYALPSGCTSPVLVITNQSQTAANPTTSTLRSFQVLTATPAGSSHSLNVTKTGSGTGTVTSSPSGISCPSDCSQAYNDGTSVTLTAAPSGGSTFAGWGGDCSGSSSTCVLTMNAGKNVTASFDPPPDTTAPVVSINSGPAGFTNDSTPTFSFTANESATFECNYGSGFAACTSPFTTPALGDGSHSFQVRGTDGSTNLSSPVARSFTVDTQSPDTFIDSGPNGSTPDTTPSFSFHSSQGGSTFQCSLDGGSFSACSSPYDAPTLANGGHSFSVRAVDPATNVDPSAAGRSFSVFAPLPPPVSTTTTITGSAALLPDLVRPVIASLGLSRKVFRAATSGPSISGTAGARVRYSLSEAANVTFRLQRARPGRRVHGRCVRPTARNRTKRGCTRWVRLRGSLRRSAQAGSNSFRFRGRWRRHRLRPGRYRLVAVAVDAAGNRSQARRVRFRIVS